MEQIYFFLLMVIGTFFLGFADVKQKQNLNWGMNEHVLLSVTFLLGGFLLLPVTLYFGIPELKSEFWPAFAGTVVLNVISQSLFIHSFKLSEASVIAPLRLLVTPLVIITGYLFLGEQPSMLGVLGIFTTIIGLWFLLFPKQVFSFDELERIKHNKGLMFGLLGSVLFAISFPLDKQAIVNSSALFASSSILMSVGLAVLVASRLRDVNFSSQLSAAIRHAPKELLLVSVFSGIGVFLTNAALNYSLAAYASSLKRLAALWTVILSGQILKERNIKRKFFATLLMFLGILLSVLWQ